VVGVAGDIVNIVTSSMNPKFAKKQSIISVKKKKFENRLKNNHMLAIQTISSDPKPDPHVIPDKHYFAFLLKFSVGRDAISLPGYCSVQPFLLNYMCGCHCTGSCSKLSSKTHRIIVGISRLPLLGFFKPLI